MYRHCIRTLCAVGASCVAITAAWGEDSVKEASALEFADADTLFIADSVSGTLLAYTLPNASVDAVPGEATPYNVLGVDVQISEAFDAPTSAITYNDLVVHPVTKDAYLAVSVDTAEGPQAAVMVVDAAGDATQLDLAALEATRVTLADMADDGVTFWRDVPASTFSVTDLDFYDGALFVSGLSTGEFASTMRVVPYPFEGQASTTSVEMFHTAHDQTETRAPIRALTIMELNGEPTVVAAYTCTPLVTFPVSALEDGAHIAGKTVAELGFGNTPVEVVSFTTYNMEQQPEQYALVINKQYGANLIALNDLAEATAGDGLTTAIPYIGATMGVNATPLPFGGVLQADDQDAQFLLTLRRDVDTGRVDLVSFRKGAYMRLSDFVSEYNFPDYAYADTPASGFIRQFQNQLKVDEGFPDLVR